MITNTWCPGHAWHPCQRSQDGLDAPQQQIPTPSHFQRQPCSSEVLGSAPRAPSRSSVVTTLAWLAHGPGGTGRCRRKPRSVACLFAINAAVCFTASGKDASYWERMPDAAQSLGVFLPLPHTGNALLLAQRSFILMAETFIVPKELVQYNSPLCTAASPMSHMQSQGKA